ncbi:MAG: YhcH/YjgK/YiaL family protein [Clostridia bacterium]|nr:YhcH/YjgK/YiaL family protein [Clostridia bacterium]MBR5767668.1 YhcH/YjgK/YiaL family protein [Clostridia bacterium]
MIFDRIENAGRYEAALPGIGKAVAAAAAIPAAEVFAGKESVQLGGGSKLNFGEFETRPAPDQLCFEAHRINTDVMILASGAETIYFAGLSDLTVTKEYAEETDVLFGAARAVTGCVVLKPGYFAVFTPVDAHAPGYHPDGRPSEVKKLVLKLKTPESV